MEPLLSIITPTYNFEKYIEKCILSVLNQTYNNWEMIIVDDNSTDNSQNIINRFVKKDSRIKYYRNKKLLGIKNLVKSYNKALFIAKGEYIALLEGDDFWPTNKLEIQINAIKNKKAIFSYGDAVITNEQGKYIDLFDSYNFPSNKLENNPLGSIVDLFLSLRFYIISSTVIIKKSALLNIGGFKADKSYPFPDLPTFLNLIMEGKFLYVKSILGFYRKQHLSSWVGFFRNSQSVGRIEMRDCIIKFLKKENYSLGKHYDQKIMQMVKKEQNAFILYKQKHRNLTYLLHLIAFTNNNIMRNGVKNILFEEDKMWIKILANLVLYFNFFVPFAVYLNYYRKILLYKVKKLSL